MGYSIKVDDDCLAHYGVKGMKWGVWNDETKRKYGELTGSGGGGGGGDDEDDRPEALLKAGKIDQATADAMRRRLDKIIEQAENGQLSGDGEYERAVNKVYYDAGVSQPYGDHEIKPTGLTSGNYHQDVDNMFDWLVQKGAGAVKDALNQHLDDIQSGDISREEARVIGIVNAAAAGASGTGKGVISNPKSEEMGMTYGQQTDEYKRIK